jgi:hypothetical protein
MVKDANKTANPVTMTATIHERKIATFCEPGLSKVFSIIKSESEDKSAFKMNERIETTQGPPALERKSPGVEELINTDINGAGQLVINLGDDDSLILTLISFYVE